MDDKFKVIYGVEAYLVDDTKDIVENAAGQSLDDKYVVFDIETTGFSPEKNKIIEIGAVKGSLYMEIKAPDGTAIYRGNGKETTDFAVNIRGSGVYTVVVEARRAKGTIHVQLEEETT